MQHYVTIQIHGTFNCQIVPAALLLSFETGCDRSGKDSQKGIMNDQKGKATAEGKIQHARTLLFGEE